ncbi:MAG: hypothetical protein AB8G22_09815 [Saprospiraceae bacterium]
MKKQLILLITLISLLFACAESPKPLNNGITEELIKNEIAESLNNKSTFVLNNQKDTIILGKNGTKIKVEQNAFVDSSGQAVNEKIELVVKEVTKLSEMIHENISTVTANGILETKGMMKIEAYYEGQLLKLSEGKSLDVFFPVDEVKDENANLYYGIENEENVIEWEIAEDLIKEEVNDDKYITDISIKYRFVEDLDSSSHDKLTNIIK